MIKTRFAPSPTGYLHIGGVRTALFSWAYAKGHDGQFVLRIEDTDLERNTDESVRTILEGMDWVGLHHDEGPYYQSKRFDRYKEIIKKLIDEGHAYYCYCTKEELDAKREDAEKRKSAYLYDGKWRPEEGKTLPPVPEGVNPVVRFKMPTGGHTQWNDLVKGHIEINNNKLDDIIIARSDGTPTYNFCVVVDDWDMGITHVIRGDDHVNNTPKQINILKALGAELPQYAHLPMIFNKQGKKMSKRGGDTVSVLEFQEMGILPEALLNYLARLGWAHGDDEIFSMDDFVKWFELEDVSPSPSRFDFDKLLWINHEYMKKLDDSTMLQNATNGLAKLGVEDVASKPIEQIVALVRDRASSFVELAEHCAYFYRRSVPSDKDLAKNWTDEDRERMSRFKKELEGLDSFDKDSIHALFEPFCEKEGVKMKKVGVPLRMAVCGVSVTPAIEEVLSLIGKEEVLKRMDTPL